MSCIKLCLKGVSNKQNPSCIFHDITSKLYRKKKDLGNSLKRLLQVSFLALLWKKPKSYCYNSSLLQIWC